MKFMISISLQNFEFEVSKDVPFFQPRKVSWNKSFVAAICSVSWENQMQSFDSFEKFSKQHKKFWGSFSNVKELFFKYFEIFKFIDGSIWFLCDNPALWLISVSFPDYFPSFRSMHVCFTENTFIKVEK